LEKKKKDMGLVPKVLVLTMKKKKTKALGLLKGGKRGVLRTPP